MVGVEGSRRVKHLIRLLPFRFHSLFLLVGQRLPLLTNSTPNIKRVGASMNLRPLKKIVNVVLDTIAHQRRLPHADPPGAAAAPRQSRLYAGSRVIRPHPSLVYVDNTYGEPELAWSDWDNTCDHYLVPYHT